MSARIVWLVVGIVLVVILGVVGLIVVFALSIFHLMDTTDAHVCGMAAVQRSPVAARLVGTPIVQRGFTGGNSNTTNGETTERITFTVGGPLGEAFVVSEGHRSPLESHLEVRIGRDQQSETIYSGAFDCPELHTAKP